MPKIKKTIDVVIGLTAEDIAEVFCKMDGQEQAAFFNEIASLSAKWKGTSFPFQAQAITDSENLAPAGRRIMQTIGDYSQPYKRLI